MRENITRTTMAVALLDDSSETLAFIIELHICKISECDSGSIEEAHQATVEAATRLVQSYRWHGPVVETEKRVVVSGVWCNAGSFQLNLLLKRDVSMS
jgi:hypothetical protein